MDMVKELAERISEEICDAWHYEKLAAQVKEEHPELSRMFETISGQEMEHMKMLHEAVVSLMEKHGRNG